MAERGKRKVLRGQRRSPADSGQEAMEVDPPNTISGTATGNGSVTTTGAAVSQQNTTGGPSARTRSKTRTTTAAQQTAPDHHDEGEQAGPSGVAKRTSSERPAACSSKRPRLAAGDQPGTSGAQPPPQSPPVSDPGVPAAASTPIFDPGLPAAAPIPVQQAVPAFFADLFGLEASAAEASSPSEPSSAPDEPDEDSDDPFAEPPLEEQIQNDQDLRQWLLDEMAEATMELRDALRVHNGRANDEQVRDAVADWCAAMADLVPMSGGFLHRLIDHEGWMELHRGVFIVAFGVMVNEASGEIVQSRLAVLRRAVYDQFGVAAASRPVLGRWVNLNIAALQADWHPPAPVPDNPLAGPAPPAGPFVDMGPSPPATPPHLQPSDDSAASGDPSGLDGSPGPDEVFDAVAGPLAVAIANHMGQIALAPPPLPVAPAPGLAPGRPITRLVMRRHPDLAWQQMSKEDVWRQADLYVRALRV